jgi:signal transduction histidine kinase
MRLARAQERGLRTWLYRRPTASGERLQAAFEEIAAEVEGAYSAAVESVVVGDREVKEPEAALVAATREAMVNAAKHGRASTISLYAEVEPHSITVFVRDRGVGFDLATVGHDRHGVRGSIIGRMRRYGGQADIRTGPGEGTEIRLTLPVGTAGD